MAARSDLSFLIYLFRKLWLRRNWICVSLIIEVAWIDGFLVRKRVIDEILLVSLKGVFR